MGVLSYTACRNRFRSVRGVGRVAGGLALALLLASAGAGCAAKGREVTRRIIEHQAMIDFSGLRPVEVVPSVKVRAAPPRQWTARPVDKGPMYTHQQWKSPSTHTGVGVAHIRMPLPLPQSAVLWLARREYTKKANDGRLIAEWKDDLGRHWFEAENNKYHVRGYAVVDGFDAWIIYFGHKVAYPPDLPEIRLAARAVDTIVPMIGREAWVEAGPAEAQAIEADDGTDAG